MAEIIGGDDIRLMTGISTVLKSCNTAWQQWRGCESSRNGLTVRGYEFLERFVTLSRFEMCSGMTTETERKETQQRSQGSLAKTFSSRYSVISRMVGSNLFFSRHPVSTTCQTYTSREMILQPNTVRHISHKSWSHLPQLDRISSINITHNLNMPIQLLNPNLHP